MTRAEIDVTVRTTEPARGRCPQHWFFRRGGHPVLAVFALAFGITFLVVAWKIALPALLILLICAEWGRRH